jgi:glycosyltransferase involved in cell wall biosynthesis
MSQDCVYATAGWGIHDERWVAGLREVGLSPRAISLGRDVHDAAGLRASVLAAAGDTLPVLAGPLSSVTYELADLPLRLVGLSWGYDLEELDVPGQDLHWLATLTGLIVDSRTNEAIATAAGLDAGRITFLPWGVELTAFPFRDSPESSPIPGVPDDAPLVLSLRAHETLYRVDDIVAAFAQMTSHMEERGPIGDVHLIIGHAGSLTDGLRAQVAELGIVDRVHFIGSIPENKLAPLLRRADCYVTAARVDGTSVTLLQAMACGTPVVASDSAGNLGWVEDGVTGRIFPVGDVTAMAQVIQQTISAVPANMTQEARRLVELEADWHANLTRLRTVMGTT